MKRGFSFLMWTCAFVGALFWFPVWSMFLRSYVHGEPGRAVSELSGLIPLVVITWGWTLRNRADKYPTFRKAVLFCSVGFGLLMLCASGYVHLRG